MTGVRTTIATAGLAALVAASAWAARAQVDLRVLRERNQIQLQQDIARQNALAAQRQVSADQSRYATQLTLRALDDAARPATTEPDLRPPVAPPPRGPSADDIAADAERMERMTDERLAAGNARLRDIAPAR